MNDHPYQAPEYAEATSELEDPPFDPMPLTPAATAAQLGSESEPPLTVTLTALAAQVLGERAEVSDPRFDQINDLVAQNEEFVEIVESLFKLMQAAPGGPWAWDQLSPEARTALWKQLGEFVCWLETRYILPVTDEVMALPACWYLHPAGVEVLTAVMVAHWSAYNVKMTTASFNPMEWHTRVLGPAFEMLSRWKIWATCVKDGNHRTVERTPLHNPIAFDAFVAAQANTPPSPVNAP